MKTKNNLVFLVSAAALLTLPAFNSEQQLRRERHLEGNSCQYRLEQRGQLGCQWPAQRAGGHGNVRDLQYKTPCHFADYGGQRHRVQPGRERVHDHQPLLPTFTISGVGITNNSGITQNFVSGPTVINFLNSATAGSLTHFTNTGDITFGDSATAGNASFTNNAGLKFGATSTAGNATITNNAEILFFGNSTAGNATFTNAFGIVIFSDEATAGNATFINAGGTVSGTGGGFTVFQRARPRATPP